jgi:NTE family protein
MAKGLQSKIGLALGAGWAVGLSHILMLEVFDELGIKPQKLSGSSIGAIMGALYASGKSAKEIRDIVDELVVREQDTWREQVIYESGELLSAIEGSMALPGLFTPVERDGRILIDGGAVNPVPYDILTDTCEKIVAINVVGKRSVKKDFSFLDSIFNTFEIMQHSIMHEKYKNRPPDITITPEIKDVRALEFHKIDRIYEQAKPAKEKLKRDLDNLLSV